MYIFKKTRLPLVLLFCLFFSDYLYAQDYLITPEPVWVNALQPPVSDRLKSNENSYGVEYLLVDHQWQIRDELQSHFSHFSKKALNPSGVEEISQLSIDFDPAYESVRLHKIQIHRDGRIVEKIDQSQISLIQREKNLDYQIYDGTKTINIFVDDVRVGDVIEYSYTVDGSNSVLSGHFSTRLKMQWSVPVSLAHYRMLWCLSRSLQMRNFKTDIEPQRKKRGNCTEYVWNREHIKKIVLDENTPNWFDPYSAVYLSDINSWSEVVEWALPLFRPVTNTPELQGKVKNILDNADNTEQKILLALKFVQDDIRYLGIEMGVRSHMPGTPDTVIKQRFGDCKDKSRLLVSMLKSMGVQANSALVSTYSELNRADILPTITVFDHAIVQAHINGKTYWLDPTRSYQRGMLSALYQPDYDYALVISENVKGLSRMPDDIKAIHTKIVVEKFDVRDAIDKAASYKIVTKNKGYYADKLREDLAETSINEIQKSYLNYTAQYYPDVKFIGTLETIDDEKRNTIVITENYSIPNVWKKSEDGLYITIEFEPFLIIDNVKNVKSLNRTMPYKISHPVRFQHTTRVMVPDGSSFDEEFYEVKDDAFRYTKRVEYANGVLEITYVYESLKDSVDPENIKAYSSNIRLVNNENYFQIQMPNPSMNYGEYSFNERDVNWLLVIFFSLSLIISILLSIRYIYFYDPLYLKPETIDSSLNGLTGWLILPVIATLLGPFQMALAFSDYLYGFSAQQWAILGNELGTGFLITFVSGMMGIVGLGVMAVFLVVMLFTKRHTFPWLFILYYILLFFVSGAGLLALFILEVPDVKVEFSDIAELGRLVIYIALWRLYFNQSERVKATFTKMRKSDLNHIESKKTTVGNH